MTPGAAPRLAVATLVGVLGLSAAACSDDGGSPPAAEGSSTTTSVVFAGDPASPFCGVLKDLGSDTVLDRPSDSAADIEAAYSHLLDVLRRSAEAAPPELQQDTGLLYEGISALDDALRAVGYDYDALASSPEGPSVSAAVNDPAFTVAGDRIQAYKHQVCKL